MPDAAVTDTNALLYFAAGPSRLLSRSAAAHFAACDAGSGALYVPAAVMWELAILVRVERADLGRSPRQFFADLFSNPSFQPRISRRNRSSMPANSGSRATRSMG